MPCGCGRSYTVNEDFGFSNRRKKDTSFRSFITFLVLVLLLCIVIYCILLTVNQRKENVHILDPSKENYHSQNGERTTQNPWMFTTNTQPSARSYNTEPHTASSETVHNNLYEVTESQYLTTMTTKAEPTAKIVYTLKQYSDDFEETTTPISKTTITELFYKEKTATDLNLKPYEAVTKQSSIPTAVTSKLDITTTTSEIDSTTELNINYTVLETVTESENKIYENTLSSINSEESTLKPNNFPTDKVDESSFGITELNNNMEDKTESANSDSFTSEIVNVNTITELLLEQTTLRTLTEYSESKEEFVFVTEVNRWRGKSLTTNSPMNENNATTDRIFQTKDHNSIETDKNNSATTEQATILDHTNKQVTVSIADLRTDSENVVNIAPNLTKNASEKRYEVTTSQNEARTFIEDDSKVTKNENVCTKPICKEKASRILRIMDHSVDPCEDFYQFSCGGLKKVDDLEYVDDLLRHIYTFSNSKDEYLKRFHKFFDSCMRYENECGYLTKIKQVFSKIQENNLTSLLSFLMLRQSTPLFEVRYGFVGGEEGYGMQILPPGSNYETAGLDGWSLQSQIKKQCLNFDPKLKYQNKVNLLNVYEGYRDCKEKTFIRMADNFVQEKLYRTRIPNKTSLQEFLSFFSKMNSISGADIQNALFHQEYAKTDIKELNEKYPQIDWQDFFNKITWTRFDKSTPIFLYLEQEYFEQVMSDLKDRMLKTEKEVLETLKLYYQLELYQNLFSPKQDKEQFCMHQTIQLMPEIATNIFYEISGLAEIPKAPMEKTFEEIKNKFYWLIEVSNLEEVNKKEYKKSLSELKIKLYENSEQSKKYLEDSYNSLNLTEDYLSNIFMLIENKRRTRNSCHSGDKNCLFTRFLDKQFSQAPEIIPGSNVIVIPNVFMYKLNKTQGYPAYISESYLKFYLSKALAFHLNDMDQKLGSTFYRQFLNSLNSYLENGDEEKIFNGQQLLLDKSNYTAWQKVVRFSDTTRMADNIALDMAFNDVYKPNEILNTLPWIPGDYSSQHQYFILIAQEFCEKPTLPSMAQSLYETPSIPNTFRIDNMIMNSQAFGQIFNCPQGTAMNPEVKTQFDSFAYIDIGNYYEYEQANK